MTTIKASCPICGDLELAPADITLTVGGPTALYEFACPTCTDLVRKPIDHNDEIIPELIDSGVALIEIPLEALEIHDGPVINYDDLLDFSLALGDCDKLVGLLQ